MLVRVGDALTWLLTGAAASVLLFGGFSIRVAGVLLTAHSAARLLVLAAIVAAARHWLHPRPSILTRVLEAGRRTLAGETARTVLPPFLWSRLGVLAAAYLAVVAFGFPSVVEFRISRNEFANLPARWDAGWYLGLAQDGYRYDPAIPGQQNPAFFPAFPLATRLAGVFFGAHVDEGFASYGNPMRMLWTGVFVNLAAFALALGYLFRMVRAHAGRAAAAAAVQFAVAYPMAFVYNAPYSEGVFLLASIAAFHHLGRSQPLAAALWGLTAGLARPNGFLLAIPLLLVALARSGSLGGLGRHVDRLGPAPPRPPRPLADAAAALAPVAGLGAFAVYLAVRWGDPLLWARLHGAWGRTYEGLEPVTRPFALIAEYGLYRYTAGAGVEPVHIGLFLFALALGVPIAFRLGLAYAVLIAVLLVPPLLAGGWLSMARLTVVLFPVYIYLGLAVPAAHRSGVVLLFGVLQGLAAALFFTWRPMY